jgi:hypothetical protein
MSLPLDRPIERVKSPFFEGHDSGTLVGEDGLIRVDASVELSTKLTSLYDGTSMAYSCQLKPITRL